jgi:hypothetical protein
MTARRLSGSAPAAHRLAAPAFLAPAVASRCSAAHQHPARRCGRAPGAVEEHLGRARPSGYAVSVHERSSALPRRRRGAGPTHPARARRTVVAPCCAAWCCEPRRTSVPRLGLTPGKEYAPAHASASIRARRPFEAGRTGRWRSSAQAWPGSSLWPFLVGEEAAIRRVADSLGFSYRMGRRERAIRAPGGDLHALAARVESAATSTISRPDAAAVRLGRC